MGSCGHVSSSSSSGVSWYVLHIKIWGSIQTAVPSWASSEALRATPPFWLIYKKTTEFPVSALGNWRGKNHQVNYFLSTVLFFFALYFIYLYIIYIYIYIFCVIPRSMSGHRSGGKSYGSRAGKLRWLGCNLCFMQIVHLAKLAGSLAG